ncbi:MAG: PQQ-binding-like beta-propeller repeat protein [Pseudomonadota bacterium]
MKTNSALMKLGLGAMVAVLLSGCGLFGDDKERLSGERIRIRDQQAVNQAVSQAAATPLPAPVSNAAWTQTNGQSSHASGHLSAPSTPSRAWQVSAGSGGGGDSAITSTPIVFGGRIFVMDAAGQVSAHDTATGATAWEISLAPEGEGDDEGFGGGLASDGEIIYATTGFGEIIAISPSDGSTIWRQRVDAPFRAAPAVANGTVVAVTRDNRAVAVSARSGSVTWQINGIAAAAGLLGGASPAIQGDLVVLPFTSGEVIGAQLSTGRRIWNAVLGGARRGLARSSISDVTGDPVIAGRAVIAANQSGRIVAIDGQNGRRGWTRSIGSTGPLWAAGRSIFMTTDDSTVTRLDLQSGQTVWRTKIPAFEDEEDREDPIAYSGPVLAGGNVLVTDSTGKMLVFDPDTGAERSPIDLSGGSVTGPVVAGGTVYVLTDDGDLHAFR